MTKAIVLDKLPPGTRPLISRLWMHDAMIIQRGTKTTPDWRAYGRISPEPTGMVFPVAAHWVDALYHRRLIEVVPCGTGEMQVSKNGVRALQGDTVLWRSACTMRAKMRESVGTARYGKTYGVALTKARALVERYGREPDADLEALLADVITQGCERLLTAAKAYEQNMLDGGE